MGIETENAGKYKFLQRYIKGISYKFKWYKRNPKALFITLSIILLIELIYEFSLSGFFMYYDYSILLTILVMLLFPFANVGYLIGVCVLYWLIDYYTSRINMHQIVRWLINTVLLVSMFTFLYTIIILIQSPSYYTSGKLLNLVYLQFYINYENLMQVSGWIPENYIGLFSLIGRIWPHFTLIPLFGFIGELRSRKIPTNQAIIDQENQERIDYLEKQKQKYIKRHKREKIKFTWRRLILKLVMFIGYILIYVGIFLCLLPIMAVIDIFFEIVTFQQDYISMAFIFFLGILFCFIGNLVLIVTKRRLDPAYFIIAMKYHWRMNFLFALVCLLLFLGGLSLNKELLTSSNIIITITSAIWAVLLLVNSLRLRRKWKRMVKNTESEMILSESGVA
jgi:hypothetical protein